MLKTLQPLVKHSARKITLAVSAITLCLGIAATAQALPYDQIGAIYFFGDSLTDSGYWDAIPSPVPLPAGKAPTVTTYDGYTWAQYVARDLKGIPLTNSTANNTTTGAIANLTTGSLTGINFAAASSTTNSTGTSAFPDAPSLHAQVTNYLENYAPVRIDGHAVFFIWSGANDIIKILENPPPVSADVLQFLLLQAAQTAATNVANEVASLSARGAKRVVVLSQPNFALTPFVQLGAPALAGALKNVFFTLNGMLNQELGRVVAQYGTKVLYVDTFSELEKMVFATNAGQPYFIGNIPFSFTNANYPACTAPIAMFCSSADSTANAGFVFADTVHPTDLGHRALAVLVESQISAWN